MSHLSTSPRSTPTTPSRAPARTTTGPTCLLIRRRLQTSCMSTSPRSITCINNQTPFELLVAKRYPGTDFALFDVWQLISDIYDNSTGYLNGSAPANVTGFVHHCNLTEQACVDEDGGKSPDSFLWYDELHPR